MAQAERFLTTDQAQALCFPSADRFESRMFRFDAEQLRAIQRASGQRVQTKGSRVRVAWRGTNLLGVLILDHVLGKHEVIDYAVAVDPTGTVQRIEILEYRESHGGEIRNAKWREQFTGRTGRSRLRLNDDIYNISGATISCRNITDGVRRLLATYSHVIQPGLFAGAAGARDGGMPGNPSPASR